MHTPFDHSGCVLYNVKATCRSWLHVAIIYPHAIKYSLGGENVAVASYSYMVIWFRINELNTAFGVLLSASRLVSLK